ncbi:MAG: cupin domain-containing protein [Halioglobus sp.]
MKAAVYPLDTSAEYFFDEGCFITELCNTPDDEQVSIARARLEPGKTTRWHFLRGITERYVVVSGSGRVEVGDLEPQQVGPGDVVLIPAQQRQRIATVGDEDLVFLAICSPRFLPDAYVDCEDAQ